MENEFGTMQVMTLWNPSESDLDRHVCFFLFVTSKHKNNTFEAQTEVHSSWILLWFRQSDSSILVNSAATLLQNRG
jgi:hypothetical protein